MANKLVTWKEYTGSTYIPLYPETLSRDVLIDRPTRGYLYLADNSTVNDALDTIVNGGALFLVGDVLVTSRTDLGDGWLLLNGETYSTTTYSELYVVLNSNTLPTYSPATDLYAYIKAKS